MDFGSPTLEETRRRLLDRFGASVDPWWASLPTAITAVAENWRLSVLDAVGRGNTSLVVRCRRADGRAAILKLTPDADVTAGEAVALRAWEPSGRVPAVWGHDAARGALLLEAMTNEVPLAESGKPVSLDETAGLIVALHRCAPPVVQHGVVPLAERLEFVYAHWIRRYAAHGGAVGRAVPLEALRRGRALARQLAADAAAPVLLHGDLHPGNVLDGGSGRGLVAIDPRPCVGDAAVDAVDWVFWPAGDVDAWAARSRQLARGVGVSQDRLWAWCAALAPVLATSEAVRSGSGETIDALLRLTPQ